MIKLIGIVHGGYSTEREISTVNATHINGALKRRGHDTVMIEYDGEIARNLTLNAVDIVYLCVQGKGHGDGTLQGMLDYMRIPYTGSDMTSAALINDKIFCKELFAFNGITTPDWTQLSRADYENGSFDPSSFKYPLVSKAPSQGASYGIVMINDESEIRNAEESFKYDNIILLEAFAPGAFVTVGVIEKEGKAVPLPCLEVVDKRENCGKLKLFTGEYEVATPDMPPDALKRIQEIAVKTFKAFRCRDYARVDFIVNAARDRFDVLELNAVPGLQPDSFLPNEARIAGIAYDDLIEGILLNARRRSNV